MNGSRDGSGERGAWSDKAMLGMIILLVLAHLALGAIEVLHRPIFPWDAWLSWMYRAKAWYLSGGPAAMDATTLWAGGGEPTQRYAVAGNHYPTLLPLLAYGTAVLLGAWSETLVNLPTLLCGFALAGGCYAVARDYGHPRLVAAIFTYLVVSTPLVGVHLSLAGKADIWMALTSGLGFAALCSGLINRRASRWLPGLMLVALGTQFKIEGGVWLLAALLLAALGLRPRLTLLVLGLGVALAALAWTAGYHQFDLPLLGTAGVIDGRLHVPLFGSYALQQYALGEDYLNNFYLGGSWHLLWYLVAGAFLLAGTRAHRDRAAAIFLAFFALSSAAQVMIFFFTEQGAWAEDWTAINRLPLQFVPALLFASLGVLLPPGARPANPLALGVTLAALAALGLVAGLLASGEARPVLHRDGAALQTIVGAAAAEGRALRITRFDTNIALLSTGPTRIDADRASVARIASRGSNRRDLTLFWRDGATGELQRHNVAGLGTLYVDLGREANWRGTVTELGLVFYDDGGAVTVDALSLHAPTAGTRLRQVLADWRWLEPWSQRSVNWLQAGNPETPFPLTLALGVVLGLGAIISLTLWPRDRARRTSAIAGIFLALWITGDARWLLQRTALAVQTMSTYPLAGSGALAFGDDERSLRAVQRATCDLAVDRTRPGPVDDLPRLLITSDGDQNMQFQVLRAKYHALPVPAHAHERSPESLPVGLADRVLVLKLRYGRDNATTVDSTALAQQMTRGRGERFRVAWESADAFLLVNETIGAARCWAAES